MLCWIQLCACKSEVRLSEHRLSLRQKYAHKKCLVSSSPCPSPTTQSSSAPSPRGNELVGVQNTQDEATTLNAAITIIACSVAMQQQLMPREGNVLKKRAWITLHIAVYMFLRLSERGVHESSDKSSNECIYVTFFVVVNMLKCTS